MTTSYVHDGIEFDLDYTYVDVTGVEWEWRGSWSADGEPMLVSPGLPESSVPLPDVYRDHGPLHRISPRPTAAHYRAAVDPEYMVDANYADTLAAGYIESLTDFGHRIDAAPVAPTVTVPSAGQALAPGLLEQTGFRAFLRTLRRAS